MPTILGTPYPRIWEGTPPHMSGEDLILWRKYRTETIKNAIRLYFDVGLGGQTEVPPDTSPEMAVMWLRNTQKRIDVVVEEENKWVIIELRARAQSSAIGRILLYLDLWKLDPPDNKPIELRIVTDTEDRDVKTLAEKLGINFVVV
uniref:Uncharacterized protein n=1 Tax=viral metagenome TaxID=1070528 RepID=A0A6H1ZWC4_9ZZZZ